MVLMLCCVHLIVYMTIEKTSLQVQNHFIVTILTDDTDIFLPTFASHILFKQQKGGVHKEYVDVQSIKGKRVSYNIHDIINSTEKEYLEHLLFCHAFTGCETTVQTHNFGKKSIFIKFKMSKRLQHISKQFLPKQCHIQ